MDTPQKITRPPATTQKWDWELTNKTSWWQIELNEVWTYRGLLARFVRRDFLLSYQQTLLGPLWTLIHPVLTVFTYVLVFNKLVGISTGSVPPTLFYLTGIILWGLFNDVFTGTSLTFTANAELFSKVYFPRLIMPLATVSAQLVRLLIQVGLLGLVMLYYWLSGTFAFRLNGWLVATPVVLVVVASIGLAAGLLFSVITAKYRDLTNVVMLLMRMFMFVTPVIYPLSVISADARWLVSLNPLTPMFEMFRFALLGEGSFTTSQLLYSLACTGGLLLLGVLVFNKQKEALMDVL